MLFYLLVKYRQAHRTAHALTQDLDMKEFPVVTIQLPLFNERYVVSRLIDCICLLDYPRSCLEIQILDDSTDDTTGLAQCKADYYRTLGIDISLIHREDRKGFKAGALRAGMQHARGEFIAIFDADFLPRQDFLKRTVAHFNSPEVGVVQTRWEHLNEAYSLLTQLQAFQLNSHFTVEQTGRQVSDLLLQFNGTAGIWRKSAITDAGGWHADTLTEDLDLSYRAQLRGWRIIYLEDVGAPAELPVEIQGLKSQQFRWMKGGAETAKKILPLVWQSRLSFKQKLFAFQHLFSGTMFICIFLAGVSSVPLLLMTHTWALDQRYFSVFLLGLLAIGVVYFVANARTSWAGLSSFSRICRFTWQFPVFLSLSMGLSLHNSIAVIQGYAGRRTAFVRTPKFALQGRHDNRRRRDYLAQRIPIATIFEGILALYFLAAVILGVVLKEGAFITFHVLLMFGFGTIAYLTLRHQGLSHQ